MAKTTITNDNSNYTGGVAFTGTEPGTLIVASDGFLISGITNAVELSGAPWSVTVSGTVQSEDSAGIIFMATTGHSTLKVNREGVVFGQLKGLSSAHALDITNAGTIAAVTSYAIDLSANGNYKLSNSGLIQSTNDDGIHLGGDGLHTIVNSGRIIGSFGLYAIESDGANGIEHVTNSGYIYFDVNLGGGADVFKNIGKARVQGTVDLGAGNDTFTGGSSGDVVRDGAGRDTYKLGAGGDVFIGAAAGAASDVDKVDGGKGLNDEYNIAAASSNSVINLDTRSHGASDLPGFYAVNYAANRAASTESGIDTIKNFEFATGGSVGDIIFGTAAANNLRGLTGDDGLWGFAGHDTIDGGDGADVIAGGGGKDDLYGGLADGDADIFVFLRLSDSGNTRATRDVIHDFEGAGVSGGDFIDLLPIDANTHHAGQDQFSLLASPNSKFGHNAGELRYFWQGSQTILQGDVNGDAKADFSIAFDGNLTFANGDFLVNV